MAIFFDDPVMIFEERSVMNNTPLVDNDVTGSSDWRKDPLNHWAFHHVTGFLNCRKIAHHPSASPFLPAHEAELGKLMINAPDGQKSSLIDLLALTLTDGFVVLHKGHLVYEFYSNGMTHESEHILMSASKSVTAVIAGILESKGVLDPEAAIVDYLPELKGGFYTAARVRDLLDMRTAALNQDQLDAYEKAVGWGPGTGHSATAGLHSFFKELQIGDQPYGGGFRYVNPNSDLLGWILERASGKCFADLVSELLWKPMEAEQDAYINVDCSGAPQCTRGIITTTRDFGRLGHLIVNDGVHKGKQILSLAWLRDLSEGGDKMAWQTGDFAGGFGGLDMSYRNNFYIVHNQPGYIFAMGIYGQNLFMDPVQQIVVAKLSSQNAPLDVKSIHIAHLIFDEIRNALSR